MLVYAKGAAQADSVHNPGKRRVGSEARQSWSGAYGRRANGVDSLQVDRSRLVMHPRAKRLDGRGYSPR
ncbi:hypothetical protein HBI56_035840 [Parastagonospora nodorum]|nr:hypothetical protein HBH52_048360 [Parastagonospora nodorum]KAH3988532.1 hypothetical protein HBH51_000720 [Parastagonospora nodorum]KAH4056040.1 hypothetical protein HBH49_048400 [Parastagonospora nodorum]KAH4196451.1 hypothetical protein HBH42_065870 [Parastagonospora nodorum]KAH4217179.1 hypothetical protein HBI06_218840 [Parastagonospora nodorum]